MKRSLKKGLPGGPNEKVFSKEGYRSTSPDVNNPFNIIPSGSITMKEKDGTPLKKGPLLGIDNLGNSQLMLPGTDYQFPGNFVKEVPVAKKGGPFQNSNIYATNKLFAKNPLFKKRKKGKKAKGIYNPKAKYTYQPGGEIEYNQLPNNYKDALKNFVYPEVIDLPEETDSERYGYDAALGVIKQNPNDPIANMNNPWWREHELFHHLQNQAGAMSTYGAVGQRPNPYVASDEAIGSYYDRRGAEFDIELNKIFEQNPDISEEEAYALAEENLYRNPTSVEGEARNYEGYIEAGNPSIFNKKAFGGEAACPDGFYNDPVKGCVAIEDPNTFYENWFQNRVMPTPEGQKLLDKIRPEALERSRESIPYIFNESLDPNEAGYYDVDTRQIMLNKFLPEAQIQATKYHERMHDIQAGDKFSNVLDKPQGYLVEQNIIEPKAINTGNPEWDKNLKKNYEDIVDPNEIHARIMTLRRLAGFRPDQAISEKDLEDYFKAVKDAGGKLDPDIEDLKGVTKGNKAIVNLLNDMVSVPSNREDLQVAKYGFELDLTEDEIQKYVKGGYVVEDISIPSLTRMDDGGTNTCPPDHYWNGEACVPTGRTYTPIDPNYLAQHPDEARRIINEGEVSIEREGSDIGKLRAEFREKNPMDIFLDEKKRQYLKKNKGLNKAAGVTMENFPEDVLQNFMNEYDYKTNNYAVNKLGKKEGWNPKRRGEWVDELTPGERDAVAESKYGSKLQPSYWSRSLAGVQELGNEVIKLLPGEQGDVMKFNIPGLTKKEQKEIRESKLGALETLAPMDMQGAWLANVAKNTGLSTGSDYKELPGILSTEKMPNVDDTDALALNLGTYAGLEALPELGISLARGIGRGISAAPEAISNLGKFITKEAPLNKIDNVVDVRAKVLESIPKDAPYVMSDELLPDYKTFKTKGRSITYDEGIDLLEDMTKKYPVLQESPRVPVYYHGTTSASLPGIIKNEGLVPVGELIREGKVPLTGELGSGVAGINNSSISTAMARGHQGALDYAIGLSGKNKVNIEDDLAKWFERGGRESFVESSYGPDISFYDDLKNKRLTEWQNLSDAEKALVQDNFPVMFGINPTKGNAQRFVIPKTDVSDEVGISGKINFEEIPSIFVPKSKVASVQEQLGTKTKVLPIEDFMQNYKNADKYNQMGYAKGGIVSNLTKKEIDKLIKQGYIIEEID